MSIEGKAKEAAGFVKEEMNEHGDTPEAKKKGSVANSDTVSKIGLMYCQGQLR